MGGRNKAFLTVGGRSILERLLATLQPLFDDILLVTRQPERYAGFPLRVVQDIYPQRSSLTGIHAGLQHAAAGHAFVVPCDTPLLQPALVRLLLAAIEPQVDLIVPDLAGHLEPLCAVYSKRCLPMIAAQLERGDFKIIRFFGQMRIKRLPLERLRQVDGELLSFCNVNNPEAYRACQALAEAAEGRN
jgi:molybdopterin-guanine dinucleotide biosynthesis protein A